MKRTQHLLKTKLKQNKEDYRRKLESNVQRGRIKEATPSSLIYIWQ